MLEITPRFSSFPFAPASKRVRVNGAIGWRRWARTPGLLKEWVRLERLREFQFESQNFIRLV